MRTARPIDIPFKIWFGTLNFNVVSGPKLTDVLTRYTGYSGRPYCRRDGYLAPGLIDIWRHRRRVRYAVTKHPRADPDLSLCFRFACGEVSLQRLHLEHGAVGCGRIVRRDKLTTVSPPSPT